MDRYYSAFFPKFVKCSLIEWLFLLIDDGALPVYLQHFQAWCTAVEQVREANLGLFESIPPSNGD